MIRIVEPVVFQVMTRCSEEDSEVVQICESNEIAQTSSQQQERHLRHIDAVQVIVVGHVWLEVASMSFLDEFCKNFLVY